MHAANKNHYILLIILTLLCVVLFVGSLFTGPTDIALVSGTKALWSGGGDALALVMREIRLPRAILALMIGVSLGLSGAAMQGYLRNPLAEPGLIGVSGAASLGAVIAVYSGLSASFALALPVMALMGAVVAVLLLNIIAGERGGTLTLILAGVALTSLTGALTSLALNMSANPFAALEIVFWLLGSLKDRSFDHVWLAAPFMLVGWVMLLALKRPLNALTLGEDTATSLGVNLKHTRYLIIFGVAFSVGAATAVAGAIGFVGLVVPHVLRPFTGTEPGRLLSASALGGGALLLAADIAVRQIVPGRELHLGVLTALIGAPFFLWLVVHLRKQII